MSTIEERVDRLLDDPRDSRIDILLARSLDALEERIGKQERRLEALEERVEEMDRNARDTDRRIDTLRGLMLDVTEPIKKAPQPGDPDLPEPVESPVTPLVEEVRIKAIDPIYKHMGGRHNTPYYWPGTNAYARDAVLAVADNIERDADTYDRPHMTSMLRGFAAYLRGKAGKP